MRRITAAACVLVLLINTGAPRAHAWDLPGVDLSYGVQHDGIALVPSVPPALTLHRAVSAGAGDYAVGSIDGHLGVTELSYNGGYTPVSAPPVHVPGIATDLVATDSRGMMMAGVRSPSQHPVVLRLGPSTDPWGTDGVAELPVLSADGDVRITPDVMVYGLAEVGGEAVTFLSRLDLFGLPDATWGSGGVALVDLGAGSDSLVGVAGSYVVGYSGDAVLRVAKLTATGSLDTAFGDAGIATPSLPPGAVIRTVRSSAGMLDLGGAAADGTALVVHVPSAGTGISVVVTDLSGAVIAFRGNVSYPSQIPVLLDDGTTVTWTVIDSTGAVAAGTTTVTTPLPGVTAVSVRAPAVALFTTGTTYTYVQAPSQAGQFSYVETPRWSMPYVMRPTAVAARADGSVIEAGDSNAGAWLTSLSPAGSPDGAFGGDVVRPPIHGTPTALRALASGKFLLATTDTGASRVYRFLSNGTVDPTYGANGRVDIPGVLTQGTFLVDPDGSAIVVTSRAYRISAAGVVDPTFGVVAPQYGGVLNSSGEAVFFARRLPSGVLEIYLAKNGGAIGALQLTTSGDRSPTSYRTVWGNVAFNGVPVATQLADGSVAIALRTPLHVVAPDGVVLLVRDTGTGSAVLGALDPIEGDIPKAIAATADGGFLLGTSLGANGGLFRKLRSDLSPDSGFGFGGLLLAGSATDIEAAGGDRFVGAATQGEYPDITASVVRLRGDSPPAGRPGRYVALATPVRLVDTRGGTPIAADDVAEFAAAGTNGIPANATALATNFALVGAPAGGGYAQLFGSGMAAPGFASNLNLRPTAGTVSSFAAVRVGTNGKIAVYTSVSAHAVVDVYGYWVPATVATSGRYVPEFTQPRRIFDSRVSPYGKRALYANEVRSVATGHAGAIAAVVNITVVRPSANGWLQAYGSTLPATAAVNFLAGETRPNLAVVPLRADGTLRIKPSVSSHVLVDIVGYITGSTAPSSSTGLFVAESPSRLIDTRFGLQGLGPVAPESTANYQIAGDAGIPANASAALVTLISVNAPQAGFLDIEISTAAPHTGTSVVNVNAPGTVASNSTFAQLSVGRFAIYSTAGGNLVLDVAGWFTP